MVNPENSRGEGPLAGQTESERRSGAARRRPGTPQPQICGHCRDPVSLAPRLPFLTSGGASVRIRQEELVAEQDWRMKSVITKLAIEDKLLRERIRRLEDERAFLRRRSKR